MKGLVEASPRPRLPPPSDLLSERIVGKNEAGSNDAFGFTGTTSG